MKVSLSTVSVFFPLGVALACFFNAQEAVAQTVLKLPEMVVTSYHGTVTTGLNSAHEKKLPQPAPGQAFTPVKLGPGARVDIDNSPPSHAMISFPGVGGCLLGEHGGINLPDATRPDMTISFDTHIFSPAHMFLNISAAEMAKRPGTVFRFENKGRSDRELPAVVFTTTGGRFYVCDEQHLSLQTDQPRAHGCTVAVYDGSITIQEMSTGQQCELKPGSALTVVMGRLGRPRAQTEAEQSYDIGCKLAALGRPVPALLPPTMKTTAPTNVPGSMVNSLGMVFVPVPGTKILMCVHETRWQDFAPFKAGLPEPARGGTIPRPSAQGHWGWDDHPVQAHWDHATAFCEWLSQTEGKKYRLPTDEEWSHAAGIGSREKRGANSSPEAVGKADLDTFPWGTAWPPPEGAGNLGDLSFMTHRSLMTTAAPLGNRDDGFIDTAPVMSFKPNKLGIYDLAGNVREWCGDWFNDERNHRVVRGSDFQSNLRDYLSSSKRGFLLPSVARAGFRVVVEQP